MVSKKICKCGCGKEGVIWSKGMLKGCFLRLNPPKSIPKFKEGKVRKKKDTKEIHLAMMNWWKKQPNKCMACGCSLPKEFHTWMVDHLLEKSKYPELAMDERNFFLVCFEDHERKTNGFPVPKHLEAIERAKQLIFN